MQPLFFIVIPIVLLHASYSFAMIRAGDRQGSSFPVDLNAATSSELQTFPMNAGRNIVNTSSCGLSKSRRKGCNVDECQKWGGYCLLNTIAGSCQPTVLSFVTDRLHETYFSRHWQTKEACMNCSCRVVAGTGPPSNPQPQMDDQVRPPLQEWKERIERFRFNGRVVPRKDQILRSLQDFEGKPAASSNMQTSLFNGGQNPAETSTCKVRAYGRRCNIDECEKWGGYCLRNKQGTCKHNVLSFLTNHLDKTLWSQHWQTKEACMKCSCRMVFGTGLPSNPQSQINSRIRPPMQEWKERIERFDFDGRGALKDETLRNVQLLEAKPAHLAGSSAQRQQAKNPLGTELHAPRTGSNPPATNKYYPPLFKPDPPWVEPNPTELRENLPRLGPNQLGLGPDSSTVEPVPPLAQLSSLRYESNPLAVGSDESTNAKRRKKTRPLKAPHGD